MKIIDITGNPFSKFLNNGKTHEAIFSAFRKNELCQLYVRPVSEELIDFDYCSSYYCVSDWDVVNKLLLKSSECGKTIMRSNEICGKEVSQYSLITNSSFLSKTGLLGLIRDFIWSTNIWRNHILKQWLINESPDLIFIDGGGDCYLYRICLFVHNFLKIPIVYYVTDDYILNACNTSIFQKIHRSKLERIITHVVRESDKCYAIGAKMAKAYSHHFNKPFDNVMNSVNIIPYCKSQRPNDKIIISYFGSLGLNRGNMIAELGGLSKNRFVINVYSFSITDELRELFNAAGVTFKGSLTGADLEKAMFDSDILLHVESDDIKYRSFTKLAISTKIPEYLMHSRFVLGYGPAELASMELLTENKIGLCINSDSTIQEKEQQLEQMMDANFRNEISYCGYLYAKTHFDKKKNADVVKDAIASILKY